MFNTELNLRIDWSELDVANHINNVMFMKYVQAARVNYWEKMGLYQDFLKTNKGPMLAHTECQYKNPLFYPGTVVIKTKVVFVKNTSFGFSHHIYNHEGILCAEANDVMVLYNFNEGEKIQIEDRWRAKINEIEQKEF